MLKKGTKIPSTHVRATAKNGTIHAVLRETGSESTKTLCKRSTLKADEPVRRFQQGLGQECVDCTGKVVAERLRVIQERKALRSKKNQPGAPLVQQPGETVIEKPLKVKAEKVVATAKPKPAARSTPKKPANTRVRKPAPAKV